MVTVGALEGDIERVSEAQGDFKIPNSVWLTQFSSRFSSDSDLEGAFEDLPADDRERELKEVKAAVEARLKAL